jgi:hypothetical protein
MKSEVIPSVLLGTADNSISTERALKQIVQLLELFSCSDSLDDATSDRIEASLQDAQFMLSRIDSN